MPFWVKFTDDGANCPTAAGPYESQEEAEAVITSRQSPPEGHEVPADVGEVVEADLNYPNTLRHPTGRLSINDVDHITYSDGSAEPVE